MKTGLLLEALFAEHDPGAHHPEAPGRIKAIIAELEKRGLPEQCEALKFRDVTDDEVRLCHTDGYLKTVVSEIDGKRSGMLSTGDTNFGPESLDVARKAAGGLLNAVDSVVKRETKNAFCAVRPPGHHATPGKGMASAFSTTRRSRLVTPKRNTGSSGWRSSIGTSIMGTALRTFSSRTAVFSISARTSIRGIRGRA